MTKLNMAKLNEQFDLLNTEIEKMRPIFKKVERLDLDNFESKISKLNNSFDDFFEPLLGHDDEPIEKPKSQWFDEKQEEITKRLSKLDDLEDSTKKLRERADKLTQAVTENATYDSFKTQAKTYRSFASNHAKGGFLCMVLIPTFIILFTWLSNPEGAWEHVRNFFLITTGVGSLATLFITTQKTKDRYIKLAADYEYKATLSESLIGYRKLHQIVYDDPEYKELFKKLSDTLTFNPSSHIIGIKEKKDNEIVHEKESED